MLNEAVMVHFKTLAQQSPEGIEGSHETSQVSGVRFKAEAWNSLFDAAGGPTVVFCAEVIWPEHRAHHSSRSTAELYLHTPQVSWRGS
jgi:hypothetical protein